MVHPNWSSNQGGRNVCYTVTTHKQIVLLQYKARNPIYICNQGFTNIASWHTFIQKTKFGLLIKKDAQRKQVNEQAPTGFPDFRHWRMLHNPPKLKVQCHITSPSGQKPSFVRKVCSSNCTWCAERMQEHSQLLVQNTLLFLFNKPVNWKENQERKMQLSSAMFSKIKIWRVLFMNRRWAA